MNHRTAVLSHTLSLIAAVLLAAAPPALAQTSVTTSVNPPGSGMVTCCHSEAFAQAAPGWVFSCWTCSNCMITEPTLPDTAMWSTQDGAVLTANFVPGPPPPALLPLQAQLLFTVPTDGTPWSLAFSEASNQWAVSYRDTGLIRLFSYTGSLLRTITPNFGDSLQGTAYTNPRLIDVYYCDDVYSPDDGAAVRGLLGNPSATPSPLDWTPTMSGEPLYLINTYGVPDSACEPSFSTADGTLLAVQPIVVAMTPDPNLQVSRLRYLKTYQPTIYAALDAAGTGLLLSIAEQYMAANYGIRISLPFEGIAQAQNVLRPSYDWNPLVLHDNQLTALEGQLTTTTRGRWRNLDSAVGTVLANYSIAGLPTGASLIALEQIYDPRGGRSDNNLICALDQTTGGVYALLPLFTLSVTANPPDAGQFDTIPAGFANPSGALYTLSTTVLFNARANPGYVFTGWITSGGAVGDPTASQTTIFVTGNTTAVANFIPATLSVEAYTSTTWVYQNTPKTTLDRHVVALTVSVTDTWGNSFYTATLTQTGPGVVTPTQTWTSGVAVPPTGSAPVVWTCRAAPAALSGFLVGGRTSGAVVQSANLTLTGICTVTITVVGDVSGPANPATASVTIKVRPLGDINGDGVVNAADKTLLNGKLNGTVTGLDPEAWDLNASGGTTNTAQKIILNGILNAVVIP